MTGKIIGISAVTAFVLIVATDMTRPRGARMLNRGKNKEKGLLFDSATAPTSKAGDPSSPVSAG